MFDDQPVHRTMERIFTPVATTGPAAPPPPRPRAVEAPTRRRWFMGRDGIAAAGFALAVTALGVVMVPLLSTPATPPPAPRAAMPTTPPPAPPIAAPAPIVAPAPVTAPAPMSAQPAPIMAAATPTLPVAATPRRIAKATRARGRAVRPYRARPKVARYRRQEAPRLYGAALRRALARDVILTRRLNQQALRRMRAR